MVKLTSFHKQVLKRIKLLFSKYQQLCSGKLQTLFWQENWCQGCVPNHVWPLWYTTMIHFCWYAWGLQLWDGLSCSSSPLVIQWKCLMEIKRVNEEVKCIYFSFCRLIWKLSWNYVNIQFCAGAFKRLFQKELKRSKADQDFIGSCMSLLLDLLHIREF